MTALVFDDTGNRRFESGVDKGVLYPLNTSTALYDSGYAWNGLTTVTETPAGAASNPQYADNIKYLDLLSAETFGGDIQAFTYPDQFALMDGTLSPESGVNVSQQPRKVFGLSYRTGVGNDVSPNLGYKLHMVYGLLAAPSQKAFATVNSNPAAVAFSWTVSSTPVTVSGYAPTSLITIDSTKVDSTALAALEAFLYGTSGTNPTLPLPDALLALFSGTITTTAVPPAPTIASDVITIPTSTGVIYKINGVTKTGTVPITVNTVVNAVPANGYIFPAVSVDRWFFLHT